MVEQVIEKLKSVKGLKVLAVLDEDLKFRVALREERNNLGVFHCLNRKHTLLVAHDSSFREPAGRIVIQNNGETILPPVEFPEVDAKDVVSSSPSSSVHRFILQELGLEIAEEEATLFVGFN
ncbi:hypothetical protein HY501_03445 [Candidatus Woesearchaeota archaeon]|nr:hypothetical protein [Candidatus Woesearchaeota archaeon]